MAWMNHLGDWTVLKRPKLIPSPEHLGQQLLVHLQVTTPLCRDWKQIKQKSKAPAFPFPQSRLRSLGERRWFLIRENPRLPVICDTEANKHEKWNVEVAGATLNLWTLPDPQVEDGSIPYKQASKVFFKHFSLESLEAPIASISTSERMEVQAASFSQTKHWVLLRQRYSKIRNQACNKKIIIIPPCIRLETKEERCIELHKFNNSSTLVTVTAYFSLCTWQYWCNTQT